MATYFYWTGAAGTGSGADWTNAFITYGAAVAAAGADGDVIKCHYTSQEELAGAATYTYLANIAVIAVDKDSADALTPMGVNGWIGHSTLSRAITMAGARKVLHSGLTLRIESSSATTVLLNNTEGGHFEYEDCYLWIGSTHIGSAFRTGSGGTAGNHYTRLKNCTYRCGNTAQSIVNAGSRLDIQGGIVSSAGSVPGTVIASTLGTSTVTTVTGLDASYCGTADLLGNSTGSAMTAIFSQCKLGSGYVMLAAQTPLGRAGGEVFVFDSDAGDVHVNFGHANALGSTVIDTGIFFTAGAAALSWKIVTTAAANFYTPYCSPWVDWYNSTLSAMTPYFEILRDGSATAYQDDEVWGEWATKTITGFTIATFTDDGMALLGTAANQDAGAGTGSWTGENATAWSGKVVSASVTPAEVGHIRGRICVCEPSITVYVDPEIRV